MSLFPGIPDNESPGDRKLRTRSRLLDAMIEVGARAGYARASVERVIEGTGIARSTFYEHFGTRDECFLATLSVLGERLLDQVEAAAEAAEGKRAIAAAIEAVVGFAVADPAGATLLFVESLAGGQRSLELRERLRESVEAILEGAWARAPANAATLDLSATMLTGGVFRLMGMRLRHGEVGLGGLGEELTAWMESYVTASGSARRRESRELGVGTPPASVSLPALEAPHPLSAGRHRLAAAEVARSQRLRILGATARCSYEKGYTNVTVTEIVSAARISRKAFYAQFRDKEHAATEANERFFQAVMSACAAAFFAASGWPERVWAAGTALLGVLAANPEHTYLGFVETHVIGAPAIQHAYDRLAAFTLFLEEGYHYRPEAEKLPKTSSEALTAVMFELTFRELRERHSLQHPHETLPQLVYTMLAPFIGPDEADAFVAAKARASLRVRAALTDTARVRF
jgi:AcrR family transcriptional regulator